MSSCFKFVVVVCFVSVLSGSVAIAQSDSPSPFSTAGVGIKVSLLGAGVEIATPLTRRSNLRTGFNDFQYSRGFNKDGVTYAGNLNFQSAEVHYDWFPFGRSFHHQSGRADLQRQSPQRQRLGRRRQIVHARRNQLHQRPRRPDHRCGQSRFKKAQARCLHVGWGNLVAPRPRPLQRARSRSAPSTPVPRKPRSV